MEGETAGRLGVGEDDRGVAESGRLAVRELSKEASVVLHPSVDEKVERPVIASTGLL